LLRAVYLPYQKQPFATRSENIERCDLEVTELVLTQSLPGYTD
jgi:hypothetical protein